MSSSLEVQFCDLPVELFWTLDEHSQALLREYTLRGFGSDVQPYDPDAVDSAVRALAALEDAVAVARQGAPRASGGSADVVLAMNGLTPADFGVLLGVLDDATLLATAGDLLTLPPLPELRALCDWLCEEVVNQAGGALPRGWQLPAAATPVTPAVPASWPAMAALPAHGSWIVGDDHNQIVGASAPALDLLGWTREELVGQRIIAIIPPRLRERHLIAFSRGLLSGVNRLLDQSLELHAQHREGGEIPVTLVLTRALTPDGRTVYVAHMQPR